MRFERVSGHPVVRRHLSLLKRDVNALKSVVRERGVMAECLTAGCQIGSLSIEQLQEAEHRLRVVSPNPILLGKVGARADHHAINLNAGGTIDPHDGKTQMYFFR